jgi:hypothetical protein
LKTRNAKYEAVPACPVLAEAKPDARLQEVVLHIVVLDTAFRRVGSSMLFNGLRFGHHVAGATRQDGNDPTLETSTAKKMRALYLSSKAGRDAQYTSSTYSTYCLYLM